MRQLRAHSVYLLKDKLKIDKAIICTDGAARGNPGPAAIGATIRNGSGRLIARISCRIGITTNNQAEYQAIIAALEQAISLGASYVELKSDSELVVKQLNGSYRVKNTAVKPLYQKVKQLTASLTGFTIAYLPREQNAEADRLANQALDTTP